MLFDLPRYHARLDTAMADVARGVARPGLKGYIGGETVDHLGSDQSITMLNGLNYVPRPACRVTPPTLPRSIASMNPSSVPPAARGSSSSATVRSRIACPRSTIR